MPERLWTILCREVEELSDGGMTLHRVFHSVRASSVPTKSGSFSLVTAILDDIGQKCDFNARFLTPAGKPWGPAGTPIHVPIRRQPELVVMDFQDFAFVEFGQYGIEVAVNDNPVYMMPFFILHRND